MLNTYKLCFTLRCFYSTQPNSRALCGGLPHIHSPRIPHRHSCYRAVSHAATNTLGLSQCNGLVPHYQFNQVTNIVPARHNDTKISSYEYAASGLKLTCNTMEFACGRIFIDIIYSAPITSPTETILTISCPFSLHYRTVLLRAWQNAPVLQLKHFKSRGDPTAFPNNTPNSLVIKR